jgi:hypothetical protein
MTKYFAIPIFLMAIASGTSAACSMTTVPLRVSFNKAAAVVLATPLSVTIQPSNAVDPLYEGRATETIRWKTLVSWKGKYRSGAEFQTVVTAETSNDGCGRWQPGKRGLETQLVFLHGKEPFDYIYTAPLNDYETFKFLERVR